MSRETSSTHRRTPLARRAVLTTLLAGLALSEGQRVESLAALEAGPGVYCTWDVFGRDAAVPMEAVERLARKPDDFRSAFAALPYFFQQLCVEAYQSLLWNRIATLVGVGRYLAAHSPTERAAFQTADIARRLLHRGDLHQMP